MSRKIQVSMIEDVNPSSSVNVAAEPTIIIPRKMPDDVLEKKQHNKRVSTTISLICIYNSVTCLCHHYRLTVIYKVCINITRMDPI